MMSDCSMPSVNTGHGCARDPADECADSPDRSRPAWSPVNRIGPSGPERVLLGRTCRFAALLLPVMTGVFSRLVGQDAVEAELVAAAQAARGDSTHNAHATGTMTHAWLITGPPGSGRSVAALCFAAALQCTSDGVPGCGECRACTTTMAGTHADVRRIIPEGLSIGVDEMRAIVQIASRRPSTGRWQIVVIEDADRLTEGAANALLKVVEEPPPSTVFLLCAPSVDPEDIAITLRSRCRHVALVTPQVDAIAQVLIDTDGLPAEDASWAASVSGGHVGRARRLATDQEARERRRAGAGAGARRGDAVAGLRRRRGIGGRGRGRGDGVDRSTATRPRPRSCARRWAPAAPVRAPRARCAARRVRSKTLSDGRSRGRPGPRATRWTGR